MVRMTRVPGPNAANFERAMRDLGKLETKVGWFESAKHADGTPCAFTAALAEFGAAGAGIPPRPIMKPTIEAQREAWIALMGRGAVAIVRGAITAEGAMEAIGLQAAGDCRKTISEIQEPALADSTLDARLSRGNSSKKPLVDTSLMFNTLTSTTEVKQ